MNLAESFVTALDSLRANKLRAALTMLGVIIGVGAVIALLSIGNGVSDSISSEITAIGTNLIVITTDNDNSDGYPALSMVDVEALSDPLRAPALADVSASLQTVQPVTAGGTFGSRLNSRAAQMVTNGMPAFSAIERPASIVWSTISPSMSRSSTAAGASRSKPVVTRRYVSAV